MPARGDGVSMSTSATEKNCRSTSCERARRRRSTQVTCRLRLGEQLLDAGVHALVAIEHEHLDTDERCVGAGD